MFYFDYIQSDKRGRSNILTSDEHVARTQNWFDVGCVRFIHLPIPTEETARHYEEQIGAAGLLEKIATTAWHAARGMNCSNFSNKIWQDFEDNVKLAMRARNIQFIVAFGHAPLVTAPQHHKKIPHEGFFNTMIKNEGKDLQGREKAKHHFTEELFRIFKEYPIDAYFCGHNHLYDRCVLRFEDKKIPMITMGVGTNLKSMRSSTEASVMPGAEPSDFQLDSKLFISGEKGRGGHEFIGYISCNVNPQNNSIDCRLFGPQEGFDGLIDERTEVAMSASESEGEAQIARNGKKIYDSFIIYGNPRSTTPVIEVYAQEESDDDDMPPLEEIPDAPGEEG